ncbi:MAG: ribulokinase, partial [Candidatus Krumholzibacteria bacterium]|nr:ribulokinase [Candidatus Krumholzibacteria bacterium]
IEGLETTVRQSLEEAPAGTAGRVVGLSVDTTGSTPVAVNREGTPLALTEGFEENPNAMFVLWKDHTAVAEAEEINHTARTWGGEDFTMYVGGTYSSEWFWSKIFHIVRSDQAVRNAAWSWVEHCDWMPALLTGNTDPLTIRRSRCAAGHKAMWHNSFEGLPSEDFLKQVNPLLEGLREHLYSDTWTVDVPAGVLSVEWAGRLGLPEGITIGVGAIDAHLGAVGGEIVPYVLSKVMGTSTCDMLVAPMEEMGDKLIQGICGQVDGSVIPGMLGMEAGQSAFGDIYAWFRQLLSWPLERLIPETGLPTDLSDEAVRAIAERIVPLLSEEAARLPIDENGIVALDWMNGRRTPDADQMLKGAITCLTLGSDPPRIFRALVEATAFGAKAIVDRFIDEGVPIEGMIALGGITKKSPFIMQVVSDVLDVP